MRYIRINSKVMAGEPVVVGTRIPVSRILSLLGEGYTFVSIQKEFFPHVPLTVIKGAVIEAPQLIGKMGYAKTSSL